MDASLIATPTVGDLLESIAGGATPARSNTSLYAHDGVKFLRILNVDDGEIVESDLKHITDAVNEGELARSQLAVGDVLMTITGRVGSAAVVRKEHLPANINQHIARLRINITVAHAVKVPESVSCNDTAWHGPGGAVSSLTIGWSA